MITADIQLKLLHKNGVIEATILINDQPKITWVLDVFKNAEYLTSKKEITIGNKEDLEKS